MTNNNNHIKVLISGGGTGGHIFPAIAIANAVRTKHPEAEILFIGAENRMEMEKVPAAGYEIIGLPVYGFNRKNLLKNAKVIYKLLESIRKARIAIKTFKPDIAVGVGGYASGPTLWVASRMGIPTLIQEQNSYAGVTNKLLSSKASAICVAYEDMERFFPKNKIKLTGNPIRQDLLNSSCTREEAAMFFGLDPAKKTILIIGGSLGARTINQSVTAHLGKLAKSDVQLIWQTGKNYDDKAKDALSKIKAENIKQVPFISRMDMAYKMADLVISRAGASSISELCLLGKPCILVPSPNVAEDHQTKNAQALSSRGAAILIKDNEAVEKLIPKALSTIGNTTLCDKMNSEILALGQHDSASRIAEMIIELIEKNRK